MYKTFPEAADKATELSQISSIKHINQIMRFVEGTWQTVGYTITDWCDQNTVASFENGRATKEDYN